MHPSILAPLCLRTWRLALHVRNAPAPVGSRERAAAAWALTALARPWLAATLTGTFARSTVNTRLCVPAERRLLSMHRRSAASQPLTTRERQKEQNREPSPVVETGILALQVRCFNHLATAASIGKRVFSETQLLHLYPSSRTCATTVAKKPRLRGRKRGIACSCRAKPAAALRAPSVSSGGDARAAARAARAGNGPDATPRAPRRATPADTRGGEVCGAVLCTQAAGLVLWRHNTSVVVSQH